MRSGEGGGVCGRNNKEHCVPAIHITLYMCKEEEVRSGGDSSSDNWRSLAVIKTSHLSDYCMRALYCRVMLSVNTTLSSYTMYWPERTQHCLIAETYVIHSHFRQAVYVCHC